MRNNPLTVGFYTPQPAGSKSEKQLVLSSSNPPQDDDEDEADPTEAYLLPASDREADKVARKRLDGDTKLRRRVYEMLLAANCKQLHMLDGLEVDRREIGRRDEIWERLRELGILRCKGGGEDLYEN